MKQQVSDHKNEKPNFATFLLSLFSDQTTRKKNENSAHPSENLAHNSK